MRKTIRCRLHKGSGSGKWGDESTQGVVYMMKSKRTENRALGNTTGGGTQGRESVITSTRKERDHK